MFQNIVRACLFLGLSSAGCHGNANATEYYVSPSGDDANPGTIERPFRTLEAARDMIRKCERDEDIHVVLQQGRHYRSHTFQLEPQDSGDSEHPIHYRGAEGAEVILDGGRSLFAADFLIEQDAATLERMLPEVRGKILVADLRSLGVSDFGNFGPRGFGRATFPTPPELFINLKPLLIAQWPNPGEPWIDLGEVIEMGSIPREGDLSNRPGVFKYGTERALRWTKARDLHITGFFANGYAEDTVKIAKIDTAAGTFTTAQPHRYGFGGGHQESLRKWYAINLLEEIDLPGDYFLDRETGKLYLYPPCDLSDSAIQLSLMDEPFVSTKGVSNVRFENLIFENARSDGIRASAAENVVIANSTLRNLGGRAIAIDGTANAVFNCNIHATASGGVSISGGNRRTLEGAANVVRDCDIHHLNRWYRNYQPCVSVAGVGNLVEHCHLHHCPGQAINLAGNDHLIQFNEIDNVISEMSDQGAIYMGRNPSQTGNQFCYNFFHHTATTHVGSYGNSAIFFDDGDSGQRVFANVFYKTGANGAVKYHGGQYNEFVNNIVIDNPLTVKYQLWNQQRWIDFLQEASMQKKLLVEVDILKPPYSIRYPKLARIFETPYLFASHLEGKNYVTTAADPLFADGNSMDFSIQDLKAIQAKVPGFENIDFNKIGLTVGHDHRLRALQK